MGRIRPRGIRWILLLRPIAARKGRGGKTLAPPFAAGEAHRPPPATAVAPGAPPDPTAGYRRRRRRWRRSLCAARPAPPRPPRFSPEPPPPAAAIFAGTPWDPVGINQQQLPAPMDLKHRRFEAKNGPHHPVRTPVAAGQASPIRPHQGVKQRNRMCVLIL